MLHNTDLILFTEILATQIICDEQPSGSTQPMDNQPAIEICQFKG
jgi:hypothetical protein